MMTIRSFSRVLVFSAFVVVGNSYSALTLNDIAGKVNANKATLGAIALGTALNDDADAAKAALETAGVLMDQTDQDKITSSLLIANFVANYTARKAVRCLAANGMELPNADLGKAGNHVVKPTREALKAAAPQVVAGIVVACLTK